MTISAAINVSLHGDNKLPLRPVNQVMNLKRLGAMNQSRLSFARTLIRHIMNERWQITPELIDLNDSGYGVVNYTIKTPSSLFSFILFSNYLSDEDRNDRVLATRWDLTMVLVEGQVDKPYMDKLRQNVPKQEAGRLDSRALVLSRANRSSRNFNYVIEKLARGEQPDSSHIARVGYLYRTTAVYGSGKSGMADWEKISTRYPDFARPFAAEMLVCFMLRNFSLMQAEHIAKHHSPATFQPMKAHIKRFFGIGNATGLGMAPFLINHPLLINQWVEMRELALARVRTLGKITPLIQQRFDELLNRCSMNTEETRTEDEWQSNNNQLLLQDLAHLRQRAAESLNNWDELFLWSEKECSLQGQEILVSIALELYPELVNELEDHSSTHQELEIDPVMPVNELKAVIEDRYHWALCIDFSSEEARKTFWYRSENKMEPRLGVVNEDDGEDKQMALGIAYSVRKAYDALTRYVEQNPKHSTARFLMSLPELRGIVRRIQTMSQCIYGDIQANLLDRDIIPIQLLRAKLAFFGVSKFDPHSRLWLRNTMFQGAPLLEDIGQPFNDDWFMPLTPKL